MKTIIYYFRIAFLAVRSLFKLNIGDWVLYNGKKYQLTQGVYNPSWHIQNDKERLEFVDKKLFKKEFSLRNIIHDFKFTFDFYNGYWKTIWVRGAVLENFIFNYQQVASEARMIRENLYKILGLPDFASLDEIKKAYRALALTHHPDRGGDPERMKIINAAHDILSKKKDEYDARLRQVGRPIVIVRTWHFAGASGATDTTNTGGWGWTFNSGN